MASRVGRRTFLALGAAALAGCTSVGSRVTDRPTQAPGTAATPSATDTDTAQTTTRSSTSSGAGSTPPLGDETLPLPMAPDQLRGEVVSGGPPKDGIPSIDNPTFEPAAEVSGRLASNDIVFGIDLGDEAKAYPQDILVWHEICNDVVGGIPLSITYCPLTGTVLGFERGTTTFGVSGRLVNNNLIMYDRGTERWWPQVLATSIPSPWNPDRANRSLREQRLVWTTWDRWKSTHPDTVVLTEDTGFARNYDGDPYGAYNHPDRSGYYSPEAAPMFRSLSDDDRYPPKTVVMGARTAEGAVAFRKRSLLAQHLMAGELAGTPVLAVHEPQLDTGYVYLNPDGHEFTFDDGQVVDGNGAAHHPAELELDRIHTFDAMWFAWSGFYPNTAVYD